MPSLVTTKGISMGKKRKGNTLLGWGGFLLAALFLTACSSSSGSGGAGGVALSGKVIDGPIANATVTITTGSPGATGTIVGTGTSDSSGAYTVTVSLPPGNEPVFATATDGNTTLVSFLGSSQKLSEQSDQTLQSANLPDLEISQVTTAALALAEKLDGNLSTLTSASYHSLLSAHRKELLELAVDVMCDVDNHENPTSVQDSWEMAQSIAGQASPDTSSNLLNSSAGNFTSCTNIENYLNLISENPDWAPELDGGDDVSMQIPVTPGSYTLQGVLEESGVSTDGTANSTPLIEPFSATVSVDAAGTIAMGSATASLNIAGISRGQVMGKSISMVLTDNSHLDFTLTGTILPLDSSWISNGSGFSIRAGGTGPSNRAVRVDAVLVSTGAQPIWGNFKPSDQEGEGATCSSGYLLRGTLTGPTVGGVSIPFCIQGSGSSLTLQNASAPQEDDMTGNTSAGGPFATPFGLNEYSVSPNTYPFIQASSSTFTVNSTNLKLLYIMGTNEALATDCWGISCTPNSIATTMIFSGNIIKQDS